MWLWYWYPIIFLSKPLLYHISILSLSSKLPSTLWIRSVHNKIKPCGPSIPKCSCVWFNYFLLNHNLVSLFSLLGSLIQQMIDIYTHSFLWVQSDQMGLLKKTSNKCGHVFTLWIRQRNQDPVAHIFLSFACKTNIGKCLDVCIFIHSCYVLFSCFLPTKLMLNFFHNNIVSNHF